MIITIDGPALSGKSTVAQKIAKTLGFYYLYTGLLYRAIAYILVEKLKVEEGEFSFLSLKDLEFVEDLHYSYQEGEPQVFFRGEDITSKLKDLSVDQSSSKIGANKNVRAALLELQRKIGRNYDIVADGRDCGSVVFPNADYKFFLSASLEVRSERKSKYEGISKEEVAKELTERDERDKSRKVAPLVVPKDAIFIDNSALTIEETVQKFLNYIQKKLK